MIESPISLTLALALVVSALPATAQEMVRSLEPDGPLTRAITRESVRVALAHRADPRTSSGHACANSNRAEKSR
jgi:hypothetical protein